MCVAMPGKVIAVNGKTATVDFTGNAIEAHSGLVSVQTGDYVLVHAGCILQVRQKTGRGSQVAASSSSEG